MQITLSPAAAAAPFRPCNTPGDAVAYPAWRQARSAALAALDRGEVVALLGPPGTGKSLLLRDLAQALRREGRSVRHAERGDALDPSAGADDVLLVDEAGCMGADALARVGTAGGTPVVLAALPDFAARLSGSSRPVTTVPLQPLAPEEVARFVAARLCAAGRPRDTVEPDAVLALARHSAGLLRLVNVLGSASLLLAEVEGARHVTRHHVDEAAAMRGGGGGDAMELAPPPALCPLARPPATAAPRAEAQAHDPLSPTPPPPARRRAAAGALVAGLGLVLAGGWAARVWRPASPLADGQARTATPLSDPVTGQPSDARSPDRDPAAAEASRDGAGSPTTPGEEQRGPRQATASRTPATAAASTAPRPWPALPGAPVTFRGPVYSETLRQGGQMSLAIRRQGPAGAVAVRFEAWGGLLGSGELVGHLSEDGRLSVSGPLMVGRNAFTCDLSGTVEGERLTGSASFVHSSNGHVARSRFTLSRS